MHQLTLSIHCKFNYTDIPLYKLLSRRYSIELVEDAPIHLYINYGNYQSLHANYIERVNIHLTERGYGFDECVPDFNVYDYAFGYKEIVFQDRYFNLSSVLVDPNSRELLLSESVEFLRCVANVFDTPHHTVKTNTVMQLYYDSKKTIWDNHKFLQHCNIRFLSLFYMFVKCVMKLYHTIQKFRKLL